MLKRLYNMLRKKLPMLFLDYYDSDYDSEEDDDKKVLEDLN